jgi:hypothetical protein
MLHGVTAELPPPSGPPQPYLGVDAPQPAPFMSPPRPPVPGTNGLAIAALCCSLAGLVPLAAMAAVVLGIVALNQLRDRVQRGKGMAITGIVLGALWLFGWVAFVVAVGTDGPAQNASGNAASQSPSVVATSESETFIDDLEAGDCFSGGRKDDVDLVTVVPCTAAHESQVVVIFELPDGPYPGERKVIKAADDGCSDKSDPLLTDEGFNDLDPSFFYPDDHAWRGDRHVICLVEAPSGTTTGSALR